MNTTQCAITATISQATPAQIERAERITRKVSGLSGLQSWSGGSDATLPLFNIVRNDALLAKHPETARKAGKRGRYRVHIRLLSLHQNDLAHALDQYDALPLDAIPCWVVGNTVYEGFNEAGHALIALGQSAH